MYDSNFQPSVKDEHINMSVDKKQNKYGAISSERKVKSQTSDLPSGQDGDKGENPGKKLHLAFLFGAVQSSNSNNPLSSEQWLNRKKELLDEKQNHRIEVKKRLASAKRLLESLEQHEKKRATLQKQLDLARTDLETKQIKRDELKTRLDDLSAKQEEEIEQLKNILKNIQNLDNSLKNTQNKRDNLAIQLEDIEKKLNTISLLPNDASKVEILRSILEHNGVLTEEYKAELIDIKKRKVDFQLLDSQYGEKSVVQQLAKYLKIAEENIAGTNSMRKIYEPFIDKLPEVISPDTELPSEDALKSIMQFEVFKGNTYKYICNRIKDFNDKTKAGNPILENPIKNLLSYIPNLWPYDKKYNKRQKQALEDSIKAVEDIINKNLSSNQGIRQFSAAYHEFLKSTQKYPWTAEKELTAKETPPRSHADQTLDSTISQDHPPYQTQAVSCSSYDGESQHSLEASPSSDTLNLSALSEKTTQTDYRNRQVISKLQKDSNDNYKEDKALGFAAAEKLYRDCILRDISYYNEFLGNAKSTLTEIEEKLKTLTNDPKPSKVINEELQENIRCNLKTVLEVNDDLYTFANLIYREAITLYQLRKNVEEIDNAIIEEYKLHLTIVLCEQQEQRKEEINNLRSQIKQIRKQLDHIRNQAKSLRQNTEKQEKQLLIMKGEHESIEREVEHTQEILNKADQAAKASFNANLKDQIDQARIERDNLQEQLEQARQQENKLDELIKVTRANPFLQGFFPILEQRLKNKSSTSEDSNSQLLDSVSFFSTPIPKAPQTRSEY